MAGQYTKRLAEVCGYSSASNRTLDIATGEGQEGGPVGAGGVSSAVLAESDVAFDQRGFHGGKFGSPQILFAKQVVDGPGANSPEKHALAIDPAAFQLR